MRDHGIWFLYVMNSRLNIFYMSYNCESHMKGNATSTMTPRSGGREAHHVARGGADLQSGNVYTTPCRRPDSVSIASAQLSQNANRISTRAICSNCSRSEREGKERNLQVTACSADIFTIFQR